MARILIVDDYPVTLRVLSTQLRKHGYEVNTAGSAREALESLAENPADLAILDIAMPVIMLTASGQDQDRITARETGANDFLSKPTSSRELLDTVQRLLPG